MVAELHFYKWLRRRFLPIYKLIFYKTGSGDACSISFKFVAKPISSDVVCFYIQDYTIKFTKMVFHIELTGVCKN